MIFSSLFLLLIVAALLWLAVFFYINDLSIPTKRIDHYQKILLIFPHADDEVLTAGGLCAVSKNVTSLILTKGERGNPTASIDLNLKKIRTEEAERAAQILEIKSTIQKDYGDGELINKKEAIREEIVATIDSEKPDLVITYDTSGLYGHPDHIVVSEEVTDIVEQQFKNIELWYASFPKRVYDLAKLPEHMAKDPKFKNRRMLPTHKVFIGLNVFKKIKAAFAHKSQYYSFQKGMPYHIPAWFFHSMTMFEYFYVKNDHRST